MNTQSPTIPGCFPPGADPLAGFELARDRAIARKVPSYVCMPEPRADEGLPPDIAEAFADELAEVQTEMDRASLAALQQRLVALAAETEATHEAIAAHPETIAKCLGRFAGTPASDALIARVIYVRPTSGSFPQRRGAADIPWSGYDYRLADDPVTYQMRHASNGWDATDFGPAKGATRFRLSMLADLSNYLELDDGRLSPLTLEDICELQAPEAIAHLLRVVQGI